ncbi:hypothetical protein ANCCAN_15266 [Ancylostoma caninum]|uniref:Uncharacterized protein n=1 Tax=Ancylostoma caninum TaxID=29170 RepID=A0A368G2W6_ANCCA|nr:hypothetical protein ANCCAN_15266 [Ancylostoma caninum]
MFCEELAAIVFFFFLVAFGSLQKGVVGDVHLPPLPPPIVERSVSEQEAIDREEVPDCDDAATSSSQEREAERLWQMGHTPDHDNEVEPSSQLSVHLNEKQKQIYAGCFITYFGIGSEMSSYLNDLLTLQGSGISNQMGNDFPLRSDTADFPIYKRDIEIPAAFEDRHITIVLTLNWDGVRFKRLSRSQAWPVYLRLEGLPFNEKQKPENVIFAGVTFIRTTPSESIMAEQFSRFANVMAKKDISLADAGSVMSVCPVDEDILKAMCKHIDGARIDLAELSNIQQELSEIPHSSDSVVRRLTATVNRATSSLCGLGLVVNAVVMKISKVHSDMSEAKSHLRHLPLPDLPDGARLSYKNLYSQWIIPARPPFVLQLFLIDSFANVMAKKDISLADAGSVMSVCPVDEDSILKAMCKHIDDARIDLAELSNIQQELSEIPHSSDSVVRRLTATVNRATSSLCGLGLVVNAVVMKISKVHSDMSEAKSHLRHLPLPDLPDGARLSYKNLYSQWIIPARPPFVNFNLNTLMEQWVRPSRARTDDHLTHCADFMRRYLVKPATQSLTSNSSRAELRTRISRSHP